ncbi:pilin [Clostridium perfringens]|uniref:Uncharacterized protein n=2 Tax=Clostridium perfringens TaxID=1502 RepID=A0A8H9R0Q9_CLOPF|nr:pilin [Clostridium perfringens]MDU7141855.1 pilin [Anaerococcus vaginalis]MDU7944464.1 pilin [Streptococcus salivarius]MDU7977708.1 pilin [Clostridioides difficile]EDT15768.1 hypothetical protein AC3_A0131 [Clostridium perfringens E str. JGS1987]EGS5728744.1 hypothetical protein [Clostridium perfringens]
MVVNLMDKLNTLFIKANFLASDSNIGQISDDLGIKASSSSDIGSKILPAIKTLMMTISIIAAVGVVCLVGLYLVVARKQEQRTEAMQRIMWVGIGLFICAIASGLVGYVVGLIK